MDETPTRRGPVGPLLERVPAWIGVAVAMLAGLALRLWPWDQVFGSGLHLLMDGDPWYHLLRAQELARTGHLAWTDSTINAPLGAEVPWPPLFDGVLAVSGWILGGGRASDASIALASTIVPVVVGVASIALLAWLAARAVGRDAAVPTAACAAAFGWHVDLGLVGRPDQHVAEIALFVLVLGLLVAAVDSAGPARLRRRAVAAGAVLALAFWNWLGSGLYVATLGLVWACWHVLAPRREPRRAAAHEALLWASATATLALAASIAALGPAGALGRGGLTGISAMPAALCLALAVIAAGLWHTARAWPDAPRVVRALEVAVLGCASLLLLASSAALRAGFAQGLTALRGSNAWYAHIREFQPILGSGLSPLSAELRAAVAQLGLLPLAALAGALAAPSLVRAHPDRRFGAFVVVTGFTAFLILALVRARFGPYLGVFGCVLAGVAAARAGEAVGARWRLAAMAGVVLLAVGPCVPYALSAERRIPALDAALHLGAVAGERTRTGARPGRDVVLGTWSAGHHLRYGSGLPVVATPFGTEGGPGALEDDFAWFLASDAGAARIETRREVRWVVLTDPVPEIALGGAVLPSPGPRPARLVRDVREGPGIELDPAIEQVVSFRLFYLDGAGTAEAPALGRYRLVDEVSSPDGRPLAKLFEIVPGARLTIAGVPPGVPVGVEAAGEIAGRRAFAFRAGAVADERGEAHVPFPYATGRTGALFVAAVRVSSPTASALVEIPEAAVAGGGDVRVSLRARPGGG